jgi:hypothetical protein
LLDLQGVTQGNENGNGSADPLSLNGSGGGAGGPSPSGAGAGLRRRDSASGRQRDHPRSISGGDFSAGAGGVDGLALHRMPSQSSAYGHFFQAQELKRQASLSAGAGSPASDHA